MVASEPGSPRGLMLTTVLVVWIIPQVGLGQETRQPDSKGLFPGEGLSPGQPSDPGGLNRVAEALRDFGCPGRQGQEATGHCTAPT